uniref:Ig-like domain-containing protein n=1 Tax=Xiphophorus couchianus TaxID=32473 RepID=A0A3B5L316_9TELE
AKKNLFKKKTLVCLASGFYPDHVSVFWQLNGQNVTDGVATDAAAKKDKTTKTYSITSRLRLRAKTWFNPGNEFSCHVTFFNGTNYTIYPASIKRTLLSENKPPFLCFRFSNEKYLKITQNAKLSYSALIVKSCLYAALVCFLVWKLQVGPAESAALSSPLILKR